MPNIKRTSEILHNYPEICYMPDPHHKLAHCTVFIMLHGNVTYCELYITFLMLFLVSFEGNNNESFLKENISLRQGNNSFQT